MTLRLTAVDQNLQSTEPLLPLANRESYQRGNRLASAKQRLQSQASDENTTSDLDGGASITATHLTATDQAHVDAQAQAIVNRQANQPRPVPLAEHILLDTHDTLDAQLSHLKKDKGGIDFNVQAIRDKYDEATASWDLIHKNSLRTLYTEKLDVEVESQAAFHRRIDELQHDLSVINEYKKQLEKAKAQGAQKDVLLTKLANEMEDTIGQMHINDGAWFKRAEHAYQEGATLTSSKLQAFSDAQKSMYIFAMSIPAKAWSSTVTAVKSVVKNIVNLHKGAFKMGWGYLTDNEELTHEGQQEFDSARNNITAVAKTIGSGLKSVADQLGLSDIGVGVARVFANFGEMILDLRRGDMSAVWRDLQGAKNAFKQIGKGFSTLFTEGLPIRAAWDLCKAVAKGDWTAASIALIEVGIGLTALVTAVTITVATAGAGVAAFGAVMLLRQGLLAAIRTGAKAALEVGCKQVLKSVAGAGLKSAATREASELGIKNFFKVVCTDAVASATKSIPASRIEKMALRMAFDGIEEMGEQALKCGAKGVTKDFTSDVFKRLSGEMVEDCMRGNVLGRKGLNFLNLRRNNLAILEREIAQFTDIAAAGDRRAVRSALRQAGIKDAPKAARLLCQSINSKAGREEILDQIRGNVRINLEKHFIKHSENIVKDTVSKAVKGEIETKGGIALHNAFREEAAQLAKKEVGEHASEEAIDAFVARQLKRDAAELSEAAGEGTRKGIKFKVADLTEEVIDRLRQGIKVAARSRRYQVPGLTHIADAVDPMNVVNYVFDNSLIRKDPWLKSEARLAEAGLKPEGGKIKTLQSKIGNIKYTRTYEEFSDGHIHLIGESTVVDSAATPVRRTA